jgi:ABC-type multidrug transport system ATPase subunit
LSSKSIAQHFLIKHLLFNSKAKINLNISLQNTGKRFNREWIFRKFNYQFLQGKSYAITGPNGSGKSTLLQIIAGATMHSEGTISWQLAEGNMQLAVGNTQLEIDKMQTTTLSQQQQTENNKQQTTNELIYQQISIAAPYLDLIEEMTANEFLTFHSSFKTLTKSFTEILLAVGLEKAADKQIRYYSSGMKQRLKLAQAFFSQTSILLLDEPATNLDEDGIAIYKKLWKENTTNRLVIVSSNDKVEYEECGEVIGIGEYK